MLGARRLAADLGLLRGFNASFAHEVPAGHVTAARAISLSARHRRTVVWEMVLLARTWGPPCSLGALPLTVITAAQEQRASRAWWSAWSRMQANWLLCPATAGTSRHATPNTTFTSTNPISSWEPSGNSSAAARFQPLSSGRAGHDSGCRSALRVALAGN
jgi:hypothetical protein